ncbi:SCP2 sterol-binding domain-containing protein [Micromonospora sp. NPDC051543]|uniref:SCP2 sterol-binding domain-containing protein n=1 Tax=Micromonospora sp. NPDC051543 TaxID=3364287 RepID=UPI0037951318
MWAEETYPKAGDPRDLARFVKAVSTEELRGLLCSERRTAVLDGVFKGMPDVFRPERAGGLDAVIHWRVGDRPGGGYDTYELVIADGSCELSPAPTHPPRVTMTISGADFLRMVTGVASPVALFMRGKLTARGDLGLVMKVPQLFEAPRY